MLNVLREREVLPFMGAYTDTHVECFEKVGASTVFGHIFKNILRKREVLPFLGASIICGNIFKDILRKREVSPFMGAYTDIHVECFENVGASTVCGNISKCFEKEGGFTFHGSLC